MSKARRCEFADVIVVAGTGQSGDGGFVVDVGVYERIECGAARQNETAKGRSGRGVDRLRKARRETRKGYQGVGTGDGVQRRKVVTTVGVVKPTTVSASSACNINDSVS